MKTLVDGQQVKIPNDVYESKIHVYTLKEYIKRNNINTTISGHEVWSYKYPTCISSSYKGKEVVLQIKQNNYKSAPILEDGEIVKVDELLYKVKINGIDYSDPIEFIPQKG